MDEQALTMTILHGLPASGKSTWARDHVDDRTIIVNADGIRRSMTGTLSKWYSVGNRNGRETIAITAAHTIAETALRNGLGVIIDMQNLNGRTVAQWTRIAARHHANVVLVMFGLHPSSGGEARSRQVPRVRGGGPQASGLDRLRPLDSRPLPSVVSWYMSRQPMGGGIAMPPRR